MTTGAFRYRGIERNEAWLKVSVAALNLRRLLALGLDYNGTWALTTERVLGNVPRRERHLRSKDLPARPVHTLYPGSSVRAYPRGPTHRLGARLSS